MCDGMSLCGPLSSTRTLETLPSLRISISACISVGDQPS